MEIVDATLLRAKSIEVRLVFDVDVHTTQLQFYIFLMRLIFVHTA